MMMNPGSAELKMCAVARFIHDNSLVCSFFCNNTPLPIPYALHIRMKALFGSPTWYSKLLKLIMFLICGGTYSAGFFFSILFTTIVVTPLTPENRGSHIVTVMDMYSSHLYVFYVIYCIH